MHVYMHVYLQMLLALLLVLTGTTLISVPTANASASPSSLSTTGAGPSTVFPTTYGTGATYNVTHVASIVAQPTFSSSTTLGSGDDVVYTASLPFPFNYLGVWYSSVRVSTNGNLQFVTSSPAFTLGSSVPLSVGNAATVAPWLGVLFADLVVSSSYPLRTSTVGSSSSRQFYIRFTNAYYFGSSAQLISLDIVLFETSNRIEVRYYRVDPPRSGIVALVGLQAASPSSSAISTNWAYLPVLNSTLLPRLTGTTVIVVPTASASPSSIVSSSLLALTASESTVVAESVLVVVAVAAIVFLFAFCLFRHLDVSKKRLDGAKPLLNGPEIANL